MLRWRRHISSVPNHHLPKNAPPYTGNQLRTRTNTRTDAPSIAEIIATSTSLTSNKAAGIDGIPAEFYKANPKLLVSFSPHSRSMG